MNICIPVNEDNGLKSPVCAHFGSAPLFMIVDTDTGDCRAIDNKNKQHQHGMCQPLASLNGIALDGMVVGGIGMGALVKLKQGGIEVFLSEFATVEETVNAYKSGALKPVTPANACGQHGHGQGGGHGCGHGRGNGRQGP